MGMQFATLDWAGLPKQGTSISWTFWPGAKGETLTSIRGCKWAKYFDATKQAWVYYDTCSQCYAQNTAHSLCVRFDSPHYRGLTKITPRGPIWNGKVKFDEEQLLGVLRATKPRTYFLTSMGDLFYDAVSDEIIAKHFAVMALSPQHRFLVLSKRPDRMAALLKSNAFRGLVLAALVALGNDARYAKIAYSGRYITGHDTGGPVLPLNIWWGTSIENAASAQWALVNLAQVPAPDRRWISFEPMMEYVDLTPWLDVLSWVVFGGASKQGSDEAPIFHLGAAHQVIADCAAADVACFLKQLGARVDGVDEDRAASLYDNHNADPRLWPEHLRVQQFPVLA